MAHGPGYYNGNSAKSPSYIFPLLKNPEILVCLQELQVICSEKDLTKPSQARIFSIFEKICVTLMGLSYDELNYSEEAFPDIEDADSYVDSLNFINFFTQVSQLLEEVGVDDISFHDLSKPEPGRVRRTLSAIINFAKFREEHRIEFERELETMDETDQLLESLQQQNSKLQDYDMILRQRSADEEHLLVKEQAANEEIITELCELNKKQGWLLADIEQFKKERGDLTDKQCSSDFEILECRKQVTSTQSNVVRSPEKLLESIKEASQRFASIRQSVIEKEQVAQRFRERIEMMQRVQQNFNECQRLMEKCDAETQHHHDIHEELREARRTCKQIVEEISGLKNDVSTSRDNLLATHVRRDEFHGSRVQRQGELEQRIDELNGQFSDIHSKHQNMQHKIDRLQDMVDTNEQQQLEVRRSVDQEIIAIQSNYTRLRKQVDHYMSEIQQRIQ